MTDYRTLPDDVKRELVFDALKFTKAAIALANLSGELAEVWGERCSNAAYADMKQMSQAEIDGAIETIELARQNRAGSRMQRIETKPRKGFKQ
jgi:hypothetical protein